MTQDFPARQVLAPAGNLPLHFQDVPKADMKNAFGTIGRYGS